MLSVVLFVLPATMGGLIWHSYRRERILAAQGRGFSPLGSIRWSGANPEVPTEVPSENGS